MENSLREKAAFANAVIVCKPPQITIVRLGSLCDL